MGLDFCTLTRCLGQTGLNVGCSYVGLGVWLSKIEKLVKSNAIAQQFAVEPAMSITRACDLSSQ